MYLDDSIRRFNSIRRLNSVRRLASMSHAARGSAPKSWRTIVELNRIDELSCIVDLK